MKKLTDPFREYYGDFGYCRVQVVISGNLCSLHTYVFLELSDKYPDIYQDSLWANRIYLN